MFSKCTYIFVFVRTSYDATDKTFENFIQGKNARQEKGFDGV